MTQYQNILHANKNMQTNCFSEHFFNMAAINLMKFH